MTEFQESNPSPAEIRAFLTGMIWFEQAITDTADTDERLNDYVPEKLLNQYLYQELEGVKELITQNETLKKRNQGLQNELANIRQLSQAEFRELRKNEEYHRMIEELIYTKKQRDFWCEVAAKMQYKNYLSEKTEAESDKD